MRLWPPEALEEPQTDAVVVVAERLGPEWRPWVMAHAIGYRLLHPGKHLWRRGGRGVLRLMFRYGNGVTTVYDRDYGAERTFQLYDVDDVLGILEGRDLRVIPAEG